jgi:hypothetical protein
MAAEWRLTPGLRPLFGRYADKGDKRAFRDGKTLNLVLHHGTTLADLDRALRSAVPQLTPTFGLMRLLTVMAVFGIGVAFLAALSVADLAQGVIGDLVLDPDSVSERSLIIGGVAFLFAATLIAFLPRALSGPDTSPLRTLIAQWVDHDRASRRRFENRLRWARRLRQVNHVVVWNANESMNGAKRYLLPALNRTKLATTFRVHADEVETFLSRNEETTGRSVTLAEPDPAEFDEPLAKLDPIARLDSLCGSRHAEMASYLLAITTLRAVSPWSEAIARRMPGVVRGSDALAAALYAGAQHVDDDADIRQPISFDTFLRRAAVDHGIIDIDRAQNAYSLAKGLDGRAIADAHRARLRLLDQNSSIAGQAIQALDDPMSLFIQMIAVPETMWAQGPYARMFGRYFESCERYGYYPGFPVVAHILRGFADDSGSGRGPIPALLAGVEVDGLVALSRALEAIGEYRLSLAVARRTARFEGAPGVVRMARLRERLGEAAQAIEDLARIRPVADSLRQRIEANEGAITLTPGEIRLAVDHYQQRAWIILSGALDLPDANAAMAADHLALVDRIFERVADFRPQPMDVWRQENYWATYHERVGKYEAAVTDHLDAAGLPGVPLKWRYASFVNAGITRRREAVRAWFAGEADLATVAEQLAQSLDYARQGYEGKLAIDDRDEAPLGAHNAALSQLYLVQVADRQGGTAAAEHLSGAATLVEGALRLLDSTGSQRKRDMILAEGELVRQWARRRRTDLGAMPMFEALLPSLDRSRIVAADQEILDTLISLEAELTG